MIAPMRGGRGARTRSWSGSGRRKRRSTTRAPTTNAATETNGDDDERFMRLALAQAATAASNDEVPVGAVLVHTASGEVLSSHHNTVLAQDDPTAHMGHGSRVT